MSEGFIPSNFQKMTYSNIIQNAKVSKLFKFSTSTGGIRYLLRPSKIFSTSQKPSQTHNSYLGCLTPSQIISSMCIFIGLPGLFSV